MTPSELLTCGNYFSRVDPEETPTLFVLDQRRRATEYALESSHDEAARFTAADAISLGMLLIREREREEPSPTMTAYYAAAYEAVTGALGLVEPGRLIGWCERGPRPAATALCQLLRLRRLAIAFLDEWGEMLEGDRWGLRRREGAPATGPGHMSLETRAQVTNARDWYHSTADKLLDDVGQLEAAICSLLGWGAPVTFVLFRELKERHGYPPEAPDLGLP